MSYNLKCCSFYPNNFDASALGSFQRTRGFISENKKVHLMEQKNHGLHTTIVECSPWFLFIKCESSVIL